MGDVQTLQIIGDIVKYCALSICAVYSSIYIGTRIIIDRISPRIINKKELDELILTEKIELNLNQLVKGSLTYKECGGRTEKKEGLEYILEFGLRSTHSSVSHELYHIKDGWADKVFKLQEKVENKNKPSLFDLFKGAWCLFEYFFYREPRALIYQTKRAIKMKSDKKISI